MFGDGDLLHSVIVDEEFTLIGSHLDDITRHRIASGEYVDFVKLIPKDRILTEEDREWNL